jgi:hypothetical protein
MVSLDFAILHHNSFTNLCYSFFLCSAKLTIKYFNDKIVDVIANATIYKWVSFLSCRVRRNQYLPQRPNLFGGGSTLLFAVAC